MKSAKYLTDLRRRLEVAELQVPARKAELTAQINRLGNVIWRDTDYRLVPGRIADLVREYVAVGGDPMALKPTPPVQNPVTSPIESSPEPDTQHPRSLTRALDAAQAWAAPFMRRRLELGLAIQRALKLRERLLVERDETLPAALGDYPATESSFFEGATGDKGQNNWRAVFEDLVTTIFDRGPGTALAAKPDQKFFAPVTAEDLTRTLK